MASKVKPVSLRAYARRRGVSPEAVSKAVMAGRLRECVVFVGGKPKIGDVERADLEWLENTRPSASSPPPAQAEREAIQDYQVSRALREAAAARREAALADLAEIEVAEKRDQVVPTEEARRDVINMFTIVKTRILGVPSRIAQQLPHIAKEVVPLLDSLLREALAELAEQDDGEGADEEEDAA